MCFQFVCFVFVKKRDDSRQKNKMVLCFSRRLKRTTTLGPKDPPIFLFSAEDFTRKKLKKNQGKVFQENTVEVNFRCK